MAKKSKPTPPPVTQADLLAFFNATKGDDGPIGPLSVQAEKEEGIVDEISEIGCRAVRMWNKRVEVLGWSKKADSLVSVKIGNEVSIYKYPFHKYIMFPFINLEIISDCGYLEKFGNGDEYVIDGKRYGVKDDVVWAGGKRYLSSSEKVGFGSFRDFLAKHPDHTVKRTII